MVEVTFKDKQDDAELIRAVDLDDPEHIPEIPESPDVIVKEDSESPDSKEDIIDENVQTENEEGTFQPSHRRKKRPHPGVRIGQYAQKAKTYETAANMLFEQTKSLKERNEALEREKQAYKEHALQLKADYAYQVYKNAAEEGDVEKQASAHNYMTQYNTELAILKNKDSKNYDDFQEPENLNEFLNYVPVPKTNVYAEEWLAENPWFDSSNREFFDPEMAEEAMRISSSLDRELKRNRRADVIGTPDYLETISQAVKEQFNISDDSYEEEDVYDEPAYKSQRQNIAPVSRSSVGHSSSGSSVNRKTVYLSSEEKKIALSLEYGSTLSPEEKIKRYADSKYEMLQLEKRKGNKKW